MIGKLTPDVTNFPFPLSNALKDVVVISNTNFWEVRGKEIAASKETGKNNFVTPREDLWLGVGTWRKIYSKKTPACIISAWLFFLGEVWWEWQFFSSQITAIKRRRSERKSERTKLSCTQPGLYVRCPAASRYALCKGRHFPRYIFRNCVKSFATFPRE